jgi:NAD(P)-dependent dehydrogenase (short-subunit alcohol dehydrogenase family)
MALVFITGSTDGLGRAAVARRWTNVLSNAVDPGWVRTKMGGPGAPSDPEFQEHLIARLGEMTGIALPQA